MASVVYDVATHTPKVGVAVSVETVPPTADHHVCKPTLRNKRIKRSKAGEWMMSGRDSGVGVKMKKCSMFGWNHLVEGATAYFEGRLAQCHNDQDLTWRTPPPRWSHVFDTTAKNSKLSG